MRKLLLLFMILGLGFSSCKKDDASSHDVPTEEVLIIDGKEYKVESLKRGISIITKMPVEEMIYNKERKVFTHNYYTGEIDPRDFIRDLQTLKELGYEF